MTEAIPGPERPGPQGQEWTRARTARPAGPRVDQGPNGPARRAKSGPGPERPGPQGQEWTRARTARPAGPRVDQGPNGPARRAKSGVDKSRSLAARPRIHIRRAR